MADAKISQLPASTTPLAGTETLPIVQSGVTKKVSVANLTLGRMIDATGATFSNQIVIVNNAQATTGDFLVKGSTTGNLFYVNALLNAIGVGANAPSAVFHVGDNISGGRPTYGGQILINGYQTSSNAVQGLEFQGRSDNNGFGHRIYHLSNDGELVFEARQNSVSWTEIARFDGTNNFKVTTGNLVIGTAGKGIDFSATPGTGTSELFSDYEEGTWTPNQGSGLTVVGAFSSSGTYTKVGRTVFVSGELFGATSIAIPAADIITTNLPFTTAVKALGGLNTGTIAQQGTVTLFSGTTLYGTTTAAASTIYFSLVYSV